MICAPEPVAVWMAKRYTFLRRGVLLCATVCRGVRWHIKIKPPDRRLMSLVSTRRLNAAC